MNKNEVVKFFKPPRKQWMKTQVKKLLSFWCLFLAVTQVLLLLMNFWNEFLCMKLFTVETICCETDKLLQQYELPLKKPVCIVTDGSLPVTRTKNE